MTNSRNGLTGLTRINIIKVDGRAPADAGDVVAVESPLTVKADGVDIVTLMFTPPMAAELALGYLASEGVISTMDDVASCVETLGEVDVRLAEGVDPPDASRVRVLTSGCGGGVTFSHPGGAKGLNKIDSDAEFSGDDIRELMGTLKGAAPLFDETGGTHAAALICPGGPVRSAEDIGRHNAVDKVFGRALMDGLDISGCALGVTGRVSSEIVLKCVRLGLPAVVSRGAPTSLAVELAQRFGLTLVGFARGRRFNIYSNNDRIIIDR
jgi:FdhD protein